MKHSWTAIVVGILGSVALIAAACGPAQAPEDAGSSQQTTDTRPQIQQITDSAGQQQTPTGSQTSGPKSVSGVPLDPNAKQGGLLYTSITQAPITFSDWEEAGSSQPAITHKMLNMLIRNQTWGTEEDYKNNAFFILHPDLATSWEQSADGRTWTFRLRDGIVWSDGVPFTCTDAKWSFDTIRTGEGLNRSPRAVQFLAVDNIACPDERTLVFNMKYPKPGFLEVVGMPYHVIRPAHRFQNGTDDMRNLPPDVYMGAFALREAVPGEKFVLVRNPDYWDKPFPYLDEVEVRIIARTAVPPAMRAGRVDLADAFGFTGAQAETLIQECDVCTFWPRVIGSSSSPAVMLHHERAPWNDPAVKEAVALALDNNKYNQVVQQGWFIPPTGGGFYPTSEWAMPEERVKQIPGYADFFEGGDPEADKEKARQILAQAGYEPNELKVSVVFWSVIQTDAPVIIEDLRAIGIDAEPEIQETALAYANWTEGNFDIGVHSFWIAGLDPDVILYEHFYTGSDRNYNRYNNPEYNRLVDEMSRTLDPEERKQKAWDAMEIALRDQAKIIVGHSTYMPAHNKRLKGMMPGPNYLASYGPYHRLDTAWIGE
jgi:peptide/nickel transport system substrate-binding protein